MNHPISHIEWVDVNVLDPNDYNPNVVITPELKLLEHSILTNGWIQPILITQDNVIIDGFHRYTLVKNSKALWLLTQGKVPCARLTLTESERMMLTVRINRAKGTHVALKMHELVSKLHHDLGLSFDDISKGIGAAKHELEILLMENIFIKKGVAQKEYSKSWYPRNSILAKGRELKK
jgi:hypothetical protein